MKMIYSPDGAIDLMIEPGQTMLACVIKGSAPRPAATRTDIKLMRYLASLIHSRASRDVLNMADLLADSQFIETPGVIVRARACASPLFLGEMEAEAIATRHPARLLRHPQAVRHSETRPWMIDPPRHHLNHEIAVVLRAEGSIEAPCEFRQSADPDAIVIAGFLEVTRDLTS